MADDRKPTRHPVDVGLGLGAVLGSVLLVPGLVGADHWRLELVVHWQLWVAGSMILPLAWFAWRRRRFFVVLSLSCVLWGVAVAWPYAVSDPRQATTPTGPAKQGMVVVTVNLFQDLSDFERALEWALGQRPDVIAIQEVMPGSEQRIRGLLAPALPHMVFEPRAGSFGMGLASRWPLRDVEKIRDDHQAPVQFAATVEIEGGDVRLFCVHVAPPFNQAFADSQRSSLATLATRVAETSLPVVMAGDFNLTPWSPTFGGFLQRSGLDDPRVGRGLLPTWSPARSPWALLPIDHILLSKGWRVRGLRTGPAFGSDHRPLAARLSR